MLTFSHPQKAEILAYAEQDGNAGHVIRKFRHVPKVIIYAILEEAGLQTSAACDEYRAVRIKSAKFEQDRDPRAIINGASNWARAHELKHCRHWRAGVGITTRGEWVVKPSERMGR